MTRRQSARISIPAGALLVLASCGLGQLSSSQALEAIRKNELFQKTQEGGVVLRVLEVTAVKSADKTTSEVEFHWAAEAKDAPECRLEQSSRVRFRRFESGWDVDRADLARTLQSAIEEKINPGSAERTMRLVGMAEGDFSARRGRYASLTELMDAGMVPRSLAASENAFESRGYYFKFSSTRDTFSLSSRSLVITENAPSYYTDHTGDLRISTKGPATAASPLRK